MRPSELSSKPKRSRTLPRLGETPFDIDPPTFVGCSRYSVIRNLSLQTWTSSVESTSQQLLRGPLTARILSCQLSISSATSASMAFFRLLFDP